MSELPTFVLDRSFDAPPDLVWRAWTDPELLPQWYGPGVDSIVHKLDVQPGGVWLHEMRWGGNSNFQRADFTAVEPGARLVALQSTTDADWNVIDNPMTENWPRVLTLSVTFAANGDRTDMRLTWTPHDATDAEIASFEAALGGLGQGWGSGMDLLEKLLAELKANAG